MQLGVVQSLTEVILALKILGTWLEGTTRDRNFPTQSGALHTGSSQLWLFFLAKFRKSLRMEIVQLPGQPVPVLPEENLGESAPHPFLNWGAERNLVTLSSFEIV